jgi:phage/plasmid primase-like uncharacterized protein
VNALEDLRAAMARAGLTFAGQFVINDQFQHFDVPGEKGKSSYYVGHNLGDVLLVNFGCFRRDFQQTWTSHDRNKLTHDQQIECSRSLKDLEAKRLAELKAGEAAAREKCARYFSTFPKATGSHPYLTKKGVPVIGDVRLFRGELYDGWLALPLKDGTGTIHTAQFISDDGQKRFSYMGRKKGCFFHLSSVPGGPVLICEGYATGASLALATGWTVICAMDCGNLLPVAQEIRKLHPNRTLILCADNDQFTEDNPGLTKATAAAKSIHAVVAHPEFGDNALADKPTDFNDLHRLEGLPSVRTQIYDALPVVARPIGDFQCPKDDDPTELLKYRYLCERGSLLLNGPAGMGKSSLLIQAAALWANELPFFGIIPRKPLKTVIIQAENDDGDIAQMRDGICTGLQLTQPQRRAFFQNVLIYSSWGHTGRSFCLEVVRPILDLHDPNLFGIDPALSFVGGDVKEQKVVGQFLREYLNPIIFEHTCACLMMHHTNKPLTGKEKGSWRNGEMAYTGSGSAEWANWPRAVLSLQATGTPGFYNLHASKRGSRLAWTDEQDQLIYQKLIAWSKDKGTIFWRTPESSELPDQDQSSQPNHHRPSIVQKIASMNSHAFLSKCLPEGETRNALCNRLESWLASLSIDVSFETCRRAAIALVANSKLSKDTSSGLYFKGPNS